MDPLTIASLISLIGGTAMQYKAQSDAQDRQRREALAALQRQEEYSRQAEKKAMDQAQEFKTDNRQAEQTKIGEQMQQDMLAPVESAAEINAKATTTQGDVSDDYLKAKAQSEINLKKNATEFARLMGKVNSANRLRGNESINLANTGMDIARIRDFAQGTGNVDQLAVQQAGIPDAGMSMAGSLLQGAGMMGVSSALSTAGETAASTAATAPPYSGWQPIWKQPKAPISGMNFLDSLDVPT